MVKIFFIASVNILFLSITITPTTLSPVVFADAQIMHALPALPFTQALPSREKTIAPDTPFAKSGEAKAVSNPARLVIPSIGLDASIESMGINTEGEIDVPSGTTNSVGWYKYGAKPGQKGAAILDAHVFAAFEKLQYVQAGADMYIITSDNAMLHFVVVKKITYALSQITSEHLFASLAEHSMNLITCAGSLTPDRSTYDSRLVVYTTLMQEAEGAS